jgi:hypothetical protein
MCLEHRTRDQHRRYVCARCVRLAKLDAATRKTPPPKPKESLSFDALMEEFGAEAAPPVSPTPSPYPKAEAAEIKASALRDQGQFRILTASSPKPMPIWKSGLFTGAFAWALLILLVFTSGLRAYQPGISYVILFLGCGAFFWNLYGIAWEKEKRERWLCSIGLLLGFAAGLLAYWLRNMPAQPPGTL